MFLDCDFETQIKHVFFWKQTTVNRWYLKKQRSKNYIENRVAKMWRLQRLFFVMKIFSSWLWLYFTFPGAEIHRFSQVKIRRLFQETDPGGCHGLGYWSSYMMNIQILGLPAHQPTGCPDVPKDMDHFHGRSAEFLTDPMSMCKLKDLQGVVFHVPFQVEN